MNFREKLEFIIATHGQSAQYDMVIEECAEFTKAICKVKRRPCDTQTRENLIEEMADVTVMIQQLFIMLDLSRDHFESICNAKVNREIERIQNS